MSKQVLDIQQMQHLKELGVDDSKASAKVYKVSETENYCGYTRDIVVIDGYIDNYIDKREAFTLQDILELLPATVDDYRLYIDKGLVLWTVGYVDAVSEEIYEDFRERDLIDAAYEMLCWCIENGYISLRNSN